MSSALKAFLNAPRHVNTAIIKTCVYQKNCNSEAIIEPDAEKYHYITTTKAVLKAQEEKLKQVY